MLSVIIPNLNSPVLDRVLQAVVRQLGDWPDDVEVWVVGKDRYGYAKPGGAIHVLETEKPVTPARARNLGADRARGPTFLFLDSDCVPQDGWLKAIAGAYERWPDAGAISGAMSPEAGTFVLRCGQIASFHEHLCMNHAGRRQIVATFCLMVAKDTWEELGGLDETYAAAEDVDFSIRLTERGKPLYFEPGAIVMHNPDRGNWRALWRHAAYSGSQSIRVRLTHRDRYTMPGWSRSPLGLRLFSPGVGLFRAVQIYRQTPGLYRYWSCFPWVVLSKAIWCWGAAQGLEHLGTDEL